MGKPINLVQKNLLRMDALSTFKYNEFLKRFDFPMNVPAKLMHHVFFPSEGTAKIETDAGWNDKGRYEMASCLWVPTKRDLHGARVCWNAGKKKMLLPGEVRDPFLIYGIYEAELKSVYEGVTYFIELGLQSSFKKIVIQTDNENVVKDLRRCLLGIPMSYESNSSKDLCYNIINLLKVHGIEAEFESVPRRYNLAADAFVKELHNDSDFSNEETGFKVYSDSELKSLKVDDDLYEKLQGLDAIPGKGKREETVGLYQKYRCETNVKGDEGYTIYNTRGLAAIWFRKRKNE